MHREVVKLLLPLAALLLAAGGPAGCTAPPATLDLITVARKGLASAKDAQAQQQAQIARQLESQAAAMDSAFDADVRLVAGGQVKDAAGQPVAFSPDWVISARKGYAAARGLLNEQARAADAANATRLDNLQAADEALDMASQIIVQQWAIGDRIKQGILDMQRRLSNGK